MQEPAVQPSRGRIWKKRILCCGTRDPSYDAMAQKCSAQEALERHLRNMISSAKKKEEKKKKTQNGNCHSQSGADEFALGHALYIVMARNVGRKKNGRLLLRVGKRKKKRIDRFGFGVGPGPS